MSEEKLTVAELLARRNQERGDSDGAAERPRRRRRSLEEGGVSVAEHCTHRRCARLRIPK